jgi:D-alanyl-D-alanine carboxypeptidase/D-alanyl-D-alanine-endopeptidase (penicillin-binding protein 4)
MKKTAVFGLAVSLTLSYGLLSPVAANATTSSPTVGPCTVSNVLKSQHIKTLHAEVARADTGQVLFTRAAETPARTASVLKLLTAAVALDVLGPDYKVTTKVVQDPLNPGKIYLVGAGDVTLSRMPGNITSYYAKGPKLDTLTKAVSNWAKTNGITISEVVADSSLYGEKGDWHSTWDKRGLSEGYQAPVSALQIDAGRLTSTRNPNVWLAKRTDKPVEQAGALFKASLNKFGVAQEAIVSFSKAPAGAIEIASIQSQPVSAWISNMLRVSDNALAEALGRLVSLKLGYNGSMSTLTDAYKKTLKIHGFDVSKLKIVDASGLSRDSAVPAAFVNDLLFKVYSGHGDYEIIQSGLPVSGSKGSLASRFSVGNQKEAKGLVAAKTGWIRTGYTLAGFLTAKDGTELVFTVYNLNSSVNLKNRAALDELVFGFYRCGSQLTNN